LVTAKNIRAAFSRQVTMADTSSTPATPATSATSGTDIDTLVLSGGGVAGIAFLGALTELSDRGILARIRRFYAVSAGSIIAFLLAISYNAGDLERLLAEISPSMFVQVHGYDNLLRLFTHYGMDSGEELRNLLILLAESQGFTARITFQQLLNYTGHDLHVFAADMTDIAVIEYSAATTPTFEVIKAIRASTAIPVVYDPVTDDRGHMVNDLGILEAYPLRRIPDDVWPRALGLAFYDTSRPQEEGEEEEKGPKTFLDYLLRVKRMKDRLSVEEIQHHVWARQRTVLIDLHGFSGLHFGMDADDKMWLVECGKQHTAEFLDDPIGILMPADENVEQEHDKEADHDK
jgi:NTE family protein